MARQAQSGEGKSVRLLKIGEQIRHVLAQVLQRSEVNDPDLDGMIVSVSEVRVSPDLRHVAVYVIRETLGSSFRLCGEAVGMADQSTARAAFARIQRALAGDGPIVRVRGALHYIGDVVFPGEGRWTL